jgi:hypothetical protein
MKTALRKSIFTVFAMLVPLLAASISFGAMLPEGLVMEEVFEPGYGSAVGKVQLAQGEVVIMHSKQLRGYWAKENLPLYKGDTIVTKEKGRIRFTLNDGSVITLASSTKLVVTQSVYDPSNKTRSTFINMALGKARFWAAKLVNFHRSKFRVKSITAVVGVRGSEWIQIVTKVPAPLAANEEVTKVPAWAANEEATKFSTRVIALKDTILEVVSTAAPEELPVILEDFEQTVVLQYEVATAKEMVSPEIIEQHLREVTIIPEGKEAEVKFIPEKGKVGKKEIAKKEVAEKKGLEKEGAKDEGAVVEGVEKAIPVLVKHEGAVVEGVEKAIPVLVSVEEPDEPEPVGVPEAFEDPPVKEWVEKEIEKQEIDIILIPLVETGGEIIEEVKEDAAAVIAEQIILPPDQLLPGMPPEPY